WAPALPLAVAVVVVALAAPPHARPASAARAVSWRPVRSAWARMVSPLLAAMALSGFAAPIVYAVASAVWQASAA
ncbi:MAG: hypothetical protein ACTSXZ_07110, partial [Alphaproteobacteria bacterium]